MDVLKAPNLIIEPDHKLLDYSKSLVASHKKDGNRGLCVCGELYSASLKTPRNYALHALLKPLKSLCAKDNLVVDYEIYAPSFKHHAELSGFVNSYDQLPPDDLALYIFDAAPLDDFLDECKEMSYRYRVDLYHNICAQLDNFDHFIPLVQTPLQSPEQTQILFDGAITRGEEGLILRYLDIWKEGSRLRGGWYKHGRATANQRIMFKMKNYCSTEGVIVGVTQRRKLRSDWPRHRDSHGHLIKPLEQKAYILTSTVGSFIITLIDEKTGISLNQEVTSEISFGRGFDMLWREQAWTQFKKDPSNFLGRQVEILHMPHGAMRDGRLRGGRLIRFRDDRTPPPEGALS